MNNKLKNKIRQLFLFGIFACASLLSSNAIAQAIEVTGNVTSTEDGLGLPGVNVIVKGTSNGVTTDFDGNYSISLSNANATLVLSSLGFVAQEIALNGKRVVNVTLEPSAEALEEVVITALGIKREEKSLGYSVGKVDGEELTRVVQENVLNSMSGKVSGVTISSTGGTGSSVSMVIRGATSLSTDNQPLFVIDGVPIASSVNNVGGFGSGNPVDYGNAISDLDPESIENVTILKGPSAAALYGTRAGNGVVLITTKKAKEGQKMSVSVSTNTVFDIPTKFINTITKFSTGQLSFRPEDLGGGILPEINAGDVAFAGPENDKGYWAVQWDSPLDANGVRIPKELVSYPNNAQNFLNDYASTNTSSISVASSSESVNYRLGFTNMNHTGLIPNSDLNKNNISLAASSKLWDKLTVSTDVNWSNSWADNRPASNDLNPLAAAYNHPSNIDIRKLQDYGEGSDILSVSGKHENPYYLAHEVNNSYNRYRLYGNITANWEISPSFNLMGRASMNKSDQLNESKIGPGYKGEPNNGAYGISVGEGLERNIDALLTYTKDWDDFALSTSVGGNILYSKGSGISNSSKSGAGLVIPHLYTVQNITSGALNYSNSRFEKEIHSIYGLMNLSWKNMLYLDLTARNDWSSTLPAENHSYFYPSASLSLLVDKVFDLGQHVNMFKIRGGVAQVGNDTSPYNLNPVYSNKGQWGDAVLIGNPGSLLAPNLKPEESTSIEFGTDVKMFNNRLRFEGTYYTIDNRNQILRSPIAGSSGFGSVQVNTGLLESKGWEFLVGGTPVKTENWTWNLDMNFTKNETKIIELEEGVELIDFWDTAKFRSLGYAADAALGRDGLVGNLYTHEVLRVTDEKSEWFGFPILGEGLDTEWQAEAKETKVGNYNPDFVMGLQSSLSYKNFTLNMTFDWRSGGQYVSQTNRYLAEGSQNQTWLDSFIHPGDLGGTASQELEDWVLENADEFIFNNDPAPIGGPTPEYGGFAENWGPVTVYDGTFAPGVTGSYDDAGNFILDTKNLGGPETVFVPTLVNYAWQLGRSSMFDADYIKLREVALSYKLPKELVNRMGMQDINFSVYSRNIMLWTKDSRLGIDPERAFEASGSGFRQGIERYNLSPWLVPIGFKLGFTF